MRIHKKKRTKYVPGVLYIEIFMEGTQLIDVEDRQWFDINIVTETNISSTISIYFEPNKIIHI